ncbi:MAG: peptide chain release factor-like protein [Myxococcales bacterium]|nr:peptide chain release factor-like protein [Myxococcales bacterium]
MKDDAHRPPEYDLRPEILERDCEMTFVRVSGPGGQHKNKRDTGVRLLHVPSGTVVMASERRSQVQNRKLAFERMVERLAEKMHRDPDRIPTEVPHSAVLERMESKRKVAEKKAGRQKAIPDE